MSKRKSYTIAQAAKKLGVSRQAVHDAIRTGRLKHEELEVVTKVKLIPAAALAEYHVSLSHKSRGKKN